MKYYIRKTNKVIKGEVKLEGSKSITSRALIIKSLCNEPFDIKNYSTSEDSLTLYNLINSDEYLLNAKDGGTTFRFMLAYLSIHEGEVILTGSDRLIDRPIGPLVDALNALGADISYLGKRGYPPVLIKGKMLKGNRVDIESGTSSQFVSALLMIAPILKNGLIIRIKGDTVSKSYIEMTLNVMKHFGIRYDWSQSVISIPKQHYAARDFTVEGDWSAASYYYEMAAFADEVDLKLTGLNRLSIQGDAVMARLMEQFGITTNYVDNGIQLTKKPHVRPRYFEYDFRNCPDIAPTLLATCAGLNIPARISGVAHLKVKESDRMVSMQNELAKLGVELKKEDSRWTLTSRTEVPMHQEIVFKTYNDHRMAMCLSPLAMTREGVMIEDPAVVRKSYPRFWDDLKKIGFEVGPPVKETVPA
ncbi:MAG TPA: 3-phosphoshikimate 1-carboxyvinyltransferase [Chitinophagales bacterium]|nr:3-phosphoshikimate 1-carboxyvinyltransferase [Chitinophagales bacterium]